MKSAEPLSTPCRILLIRHATSAGNGSFQGQRDSALTASGLRELRELAKKCADYPVRAVYSSDLQRARQTAEALGRKFRLQVEVRADLREMHFGEWQGLAWNQIARQYPKLAASWMERFPHQPIPGAEPIRKFRRRIAGAMREIVALHRGQCAVVVSHAGVIRFTIANALGMPAKNSFRLAQDPRALNVIDYFDKSAVVRCINA
jgi:alpha-ribazole phosphatase